MRGYSKMVWDRIARFVYSPDSHAPFWRGMTAGARLRSAFRFSALRRHSLGYVRPSLPQTGPEVTHAHVRTPAARSQRRPSPQRARPRSPHGSPSPEAHTAQQWHASLTTPKKQESGANGQRDGSHASGHPLSGLCVTSRARMSEAASRHTTTFTSHMIMRVCAAGTRDRDLPGAHRLPPQTATKPQHQLPGLSIVAPDCDFTLSSSSSADLLNLHHVHYMA